jgi:hypothetical protein
MKKLGTDQFLVMLATIHFRIFRLLLSFLTNVKVKIYKHIILCIVL